MNRITYSHDSQHSVATSQPTGLLQSLRRSRTGVAAAEFALLLPLLLSIFSGALQYGTLMFTYNSMLNSARSAARAASLGESSNAQIKADLRSWLPAWVPADAITVETTALSGDRIRVDVSIPSSQATVLRFGPMPATIGTSIIMAREV